MKQRSSKVATAAALVSLTAGLLILMFYLFRQGLDKASEWATFLVLPATAISTVAGVWTVVLAVQALRGGGKTARGTGEGNRAEEKTSSSAPAGVAFSNTVEGNTFHGPVNLNAGVQIVEGDLRQ